ncbi:MAG: heavy-metal-associated domain-containing protein [Crocinitomicaceae bacterium]|nr:heavy-metal-associated domain-containing protein [Crocinitomicaceae bacterium]
MKFIYPFMLLFIVSCQSDASHNANTDVQKLEELADEKKPEADYQCVAKVSGMVCKMGCGGAIRKELTSLKGVSRVAVDYEENREEQIIRVFYNSRFHNEKEIYAELEKINDGQFSVGTTKSESLNNPL